MRRRARVSRLQASPIPGLEASQGCLPIMEANLRGGRRASAGHARGFAGPVGWAGIGMDRCVREGKFAGESPPKAPTAAPTARNEGRPYSRSPPVAKRHVARVNVAD